MSDSNSRAAPDKKQTGGSVPGLGLSRYAAIREVTTDVLNRMTPAQLQDHSYVEQAVLEGCQMRIEVENTFRAKGNKWKQLHELMPVQIADIIVKSSRVTCIVIDGDFSHKKESDLIGIYNEFGLNAGIYTTDEDVFFSLAKSYSYGITSNEFAEVMVNIRDACGRVAICRDRNLIAVNNGLFDYESKQLLPFTPDKVFLSKSKVDYNPNAVNPMIVEPDGNVWDVESWMGELSDDPEVVNLLWCIIGAIIRPNVPWYKSAWFYSESGNNGKGTLCELMRQICGAGSFTSITLSDFGKDFMLEQLANSSAIIVDENDVGTFIDKAANLKAVITGDSFMINRKYKSAIVMSFHGFMVQCLNEMPRVKDKSDSFFRRQLFVPFTKSFTGREKKYIKNDFLHRKDVLEYVLYRVLNMNYYELPEPEACKTALNEYKEYVNSVRSFLLEIMPQVEWSLLPYQFLYDLYVAWYKRTNGGDKNVSGRRSFIKDVHQMLPELFPEWEPTGDSGMRPANRMNNPEPLIHEYNLVDWMNPVYVKSNSIEKQCKPLLSEKYKGIYKP